MLELMLLYLAADTLTTMVSRVEVNQRGLIEKILSRYSSEFSVLRELIQNAEDAGKDYSFQVEPKDARTLARNLFVFRQIRHDSSVGARQVIIRIHTHDGQVWRSV